MGKWSFSERFSRGGVAAGVDEAGSGSLIGDIYAAAVVWDKRQKRIMGVDDSKALDPEVREKLYKLIVKRCKEYALGIATLEEVLKYKAYKASSIARLRAVKNLKTKPDVVLVDGFPMPEIEKEGIKSFGIVKGDTLCAEIMMASIIAKVERDKKILELDREYPQYNWKSNKGYYCPEHIISIVKFGASPYHRVHLPTVKNALKLRKILKENGLFEKFQQIKSYKEAKKFLKEHHLWGRR